MANSVYLLSRLQCKKVAWGIGLNYHNSERVPVFPKFLDDFDLTGIRDYDQPWWEWVPDVTCKYPFERIPVTVRRNLGIYEHMDCSIKLAGDRRSQRTDDKTLLMCVLEDRLQFLAESNMVVSNSYHGVYWAQLLNKPVMIIEPFSSRFYWMKYQPRQGTAAEAMSAPIERVPGQENLLLECREANDKFYQKVRNLL